MDWLKGVPPSRSTNDNALLALTAHLGDGGTEVVTIGGSLGTLEGNDLERLLMTSDHIGALLMPLAKLP